jgi:hypothetical protein
MDGLFMVRHSPNLRVLCWSRRHASNEELICDVFDETIGHRPVAAGAVEGLGESMILPTWLKSVGTLG